MPRPSGSLRNFSRQPEDFTTRRMHSERFTVPRRKKLAGTALEDSGVGRRRAAAMAVENFFACEADFYGAVQKERGFCYHDLVIEGIGLAAEAAAVGSGDDADVRGRHLQDFGERAMDIVGSLRAGPNGEFAIGIFGGHGGVLLDGEMRAALVEKGVFEDFVGFGEALIDVAELECYAFVNVAFVAVVVDAGCWRG